MEFRCKPVGYFRLHEIMMDRIYYENKREGKTA